MNFPLDTFHPHASFPPCPLSSSPTIASFIPCHPHHHLHIIHAPIIIIIASNPHTHCITRFIYPSIQSSCSVCLDPDSCRCDRELQDCCASSCTHVASQEASDETPLQFSPSPSPHAFVHSSRATLPSLPLSPSPLLCSPSTSFIPSPQRLLSLE